MKNLRINNGFVRVCLACLMLLTACSVESAPIPAVFKATQQAQQPTGKLVYLSEHALHEYDLATKTNTELKAASTIYSILLPGSIFRSLPMDVYYYLMDMTPSLDAPPSDPSSPAQRPVRTAFLPMI
ncbi:hypothetical protein SDC9_108954 [bioreactor metagenome]|uniref:Uncharacterized protein n=1 Tax=bioreactor metagenome TaxID=1076179 RepID=A0A645BAL4_9ZZZZ